MPETSQPRSAAPPPGFAQTIPSVAVVVVNYGTADLACMAVDSVLDRDHGGRHVEVHLVDNASPGDDAAILTRRAAAPDWRDRVTVYPETVNHGFGRGNNVALKRLAARADPPGAVFFLNPDARLGNGTIDILATLMEADPRLGFAGAGVSKPESGPVTAAFRFPGLASEIGTALSFGPVSRLLSRWQVALPPDHPAGPVDWVTGAAFLARSEALGTIDDFDPDFFLYYEEVDLMRRARAAGWGIRYAPEARVIHSEGAATGVRSNEAMRRRRPQYWYRSWRLYFGKSRGRFGALGIAACVLGAGALHFPLARLRGRTPSLPLHFLPDFWQGVVRPLFRDDDPVS